MDQQPSPSCPCTLSRTSRGTLRPPITKHQQVDLDRAAASHLTTEFVFACVISKQCPMALCGAFWRLERATPSRDKLLLKSCDKCMRFDTRHHKSRAQSPSYSYITRCSAWSLMPLRLMPILSSCSSLNACKTDCICLIWKRTQRFLKLLRILVAMWPTAVAASSRACWAQTNVLPDVLLYIFICEFLFVTAQTQSGGCLRGIFRCPTGLGSTKR